MEPQTPTQWIFVANERGADADAVNKSRPESIGSIYLAGYAVECSLKGYLRAAGIPFPRSGRAGHDLSALWEASKFCKRDIDDSDGSKVFYFEGWSTNLRYFVAHTSGGLTREELLSGAKRLAGWLQMQTRRAAQLRRRRA